MSGTKTHPTDEAWAYFMDHHGDIRSVCEMFLSVPSFEIPNTRVALSFPDDSEFVTEQRAKASLPVKNTLVDFDAAVRAKDSDRLTRIMNDAWLRAPEDRGVYRIPGFTPMCDLLDRTVDGFFGEPSGDDSDEVAF